MGTRKKLVIADDNKELCELVVEILGRHGYDVDAVYNGYELLAYLENNNPLVVILDLMMPDKDGISVFSTIKQLAPLSHIIIYTGYQEYQDSVYARKADRFIVKGGAVEKLIEAVKELT